MKNHTLESDLMAFAIYRDDSSGIKGEAWNITTPFHSEDVMKSLIEDVPQHIIKDAIQTLNHYLEQPETQNTERYLDKNEAAEYLSTTVATLRRWEDDGLIEPYRIGKRQDRRYTKSQLNDLLTKQNQ